MARKKPSGMSGPWKEGETISFVFGQGRVGGFEEYDIVVKG